MNLIDPPKKFLLRKYQKVPGAYETLNPALQIPGNNKVRIYSKIRTYSINFIRLYSPILKSSYALLKQYWYNDQYIRFFHSEFDLSSFEFESATEQILKNVINNSHLKQSKKDVKFGITNYSVKFEFCEIAKQIGKQWIRPRLSSKPADSESWYSQQDIVRIPVSI